MDSLEHIIKQGERAAFIGLLFEEGRNDAGKAYFNKLDREDRITMVLTYIEMLYLPDDDALPHTLAYRVLQAIVPQL